MSTLGMKGGPKVPNAAFVQKLHKVLDSLLGSTNIDTVLFSKESVAVHPLGVDKEGIDGTVFFLSQKATGGVESKFYLCWLPDSILAIINQGLLAPSSKYSKPSNQSFGSQPNASGSPDTTPDHQMHVSELSTAYDMHTFEHSPDWMHAFAIESSEIHILKQTVEQFRWSCLAIASKAGIEHPPLYFHDGGLAKLMSQLQQKMNLTEIAPGTYRVEPFNEKLRKSLNQLNLGGYANILEKPSFSLLQLGSKVTKKFRETGALLTGAQEKSMLEDLALGDIEGARRQDSWCNIDFEQLPSSSASSEPVVAAAGPKPSEKINDAPGLRQPMAWETPTQAKRNAEPLTECRWRAGFDEEGRMSSDEWTHIKQAIFDGGVEASIQAQVWPFILGFYKPDSTAAERAVYRQQKDSEYHQYKQQWTSITAEQESHFKEFRDRRWRIEKDVVRTDRLYPFYEDETNITMLNDILLTYSFYNFDLGYCQGMGDLLSPLLMLLQDEVDAFWAFACVMDSLGGNFNRDENAMQWQLTAIGKLLKVVDRHLWDYFEQMDGLNFFFCFRWILVRFKREFEYPDILTLWEVLWTCPFADNGLDYHLWMCVYLLHSKRSTIVNEEMKNDDLLKYMNDLSGKLNVTELICNTNALHEAYRDTPIPLCLKNQ